MLSRKTHFAGDIILQHSYFKYIDGLVQERRSSSALSMVLRLSVTNPSMYGRNFCLYWDYLTPVKLLCVSSDFYGNARLCLSGNYRSKVIQCLVH